MQENYTKKLADDEVDLSGIGKKIAAVVSYPFGLFAANLKTTVLFVILGVAAAYSTKLIIPKSYSSSFIIQPTNPREKFHLKILADIEKMLKKKDYSTLASELKLDSATVLKISGIEFYNSVSRPSPDSVNYTEVIIHTPDHALFLPVQKSIVSYLESTPYFAKIKSLQSRQVAMNMEQVNKDLPQLDSLKQMQLANYAKQQIQSQGPLLLNDLMQPTAVYSMSIERMNKKGELMAQQVFEDNFQVIKNCVAVKYHSWPPRVLQVCLYFIPAALLLCFLFLLLKQRLTKGRAA